MFSLLQEKKGVRAVRGVLGRGTFQRRRTRFWLSHVRGPLTRRCLLVARQGAGGKLVSAVFAARASHNNVMYPPMVVALTHDGVQAGVGACMRGFYQVGAKITHNHAC